MHKEIVPIKRALLSVSDKTGIVSLAQALHGLGIEIISTGGTAALLAGNGIPVTSISEVTGFPEMMNGRLKTLHPMIHGGILGLRDRHDGDAQSHGIQWIDLVVCNLYPFAKTIEEPSASVDAAMEQIDIGGPTMIRSAAKNVGWVTVLTDTSQYGPLFDELSDHGGVSFETRRACSAAAFRHTASYDALIQSYLTDDPFPQAITCTFTRHQSLRYGENPHQRSASYRAVLPPDKRDDLSVLNAEVLGGKELSFNNINDADGALLTLREFSQPACVVVKHANPCGVAQRDDITEALTCAVEADKLSAFGGVIAVNRTCTKEIAAYLRNFFFEIMIAPDYDPKALDMLKRKKQLRILKTGEISPLKQVQVWKYVSGGLLLQDADTSAVGKEELQTVTKRTPDDQETEDMLFAWKVLKHVKSNGILTAKDRITQGIGPGQVSRVDAVRIALQKTPVTDGAVLASDAFFPFRDSIDEIAATGIRAIIQPGGSVRDQEVIDACDEHGIAMVFTGIRCFFHG